MIINLWCKIETEFPNTRYDPAFSIPALIVEQQQRYPRHGANPSGPDDHVIYFPPPVPAGSVIVKANDNIGKTHIRRQIEIDGIKQINGFTAETPRTQRKTLLFFVENGNQ